MSLSLKLGRILGIDIKMHVTFLLILFWGAFFYGGSGGPLYGLLITVLLFVIVLLHELGHSIAAMLFDIKVRDIILLPIGGVARLERMPEKPWQELVVALAGPLVNVVLFLMILPLISGLTWAQDSSAMLSIQQPGFLGILWFLLLANLSLIIFNMIPAFPLDGGRVFRATLGLFMDYQRATSVAVQVGRFFAFGLGIYAIINGEFFLVIISLFIYTAGSQENKAVKAREVLRGLSVGRIISPNNLAFAPHATVEQVASKIFSTHQPNFAVLDPDSHQLLGVATSQQVTQALAHGQLYKRLTEVMVLARDIPRIAFHASLEEAQEMLDQTSSKVLAVYDGLQFLGLVDLADIYRAFSLITHQRDKPYSRNLSS
ncbi:site-2 protease family protein [Anaerolineales bacterium HSG6]|nr:site-2 protease family protein [Anaerolineales bacterium HSG6]MDM8532601.1 site-2 protease family protein [Anaerolineales bacterium HSG25]